MITCLARVGQSVAHVSLVETPQTVGVRAAFFLVQIGCMLAMAGRVAWGA